MHESGTSSRTGCKQLKVLVICTGNRARSQIGEGWLRHIGGDRLEVFSAGTEPKGVHPLAVKVMAEVGVDITGQTSDHVERYVADEFDLVLTVCDHAREQCPVFPKAKRTLHQAFLDPGDVPGDDDVMLAVFRQIRDEIGDFSRQLVGEL